MCVYGTISIKKNLEEFALILMNSWFDLLYFTNNSRDEKGTDPSMKLSQLP